MSKEPERGLWGYVNGNLEKIREPKKIEVAAPFVHMDELNPALECMHCGEFFTSKARMLQHYRTNGLEIVAGERPKPIRPPKANFGKIRETVEEQLNAIKYGDAPITEMEKEQCLREERELKAYKMRNWIRH